MKLDRDVRAGIIILAFGLFGVLIAALELALYEGGILVDEFITNTVVISDLMAVTVIVFLILGVVVGVATR